VITSLSPSSVVAGSPAFNLTINGSGFVEGVTTVRFGNNVVYDYREWVSVTPTTLVIRIAAPYIATARVQEVTVNNLPGTSGGGTATADLTINNPLPSIASVSTNLPPPNDQNAVPSGGPAFRMLVSGSGFAPGALIELADPQNPLNPGTPAARITNRVASTQLTTDIAASDIATSRTMAVTVTNPAPGGGRSPTSVPFTVYFVPTLQTVFVGIVPWFQTRVTFDDPPPPMTLAPLDGVYPRPPSQLPPRLSFPTGQWEWADEVVNNIRVRDAFFSVTGAPANSRRFSFAHGPRILSGMEVITKTAGTITLRDNNGRAVTQQIAVGPVQAVATGWFDQPSADITVESPAGRELGITSISYLGLP
jgi:hypothetical protein